MSIPKPCIIPDGGFRDDLKAYIDRELSPRRRMAVYAHLRHCSACLEEKRFMETITRELTDSEKTGAPGLSDGLRSRILGQIGSVTQPSPLPVTPPLWRRQPLLVFGGGGTALAASLLIFMSLQSQVPVNSPTGAFHKDYQLAVASQQYTQDYDERAAAAPASANRVAVVSAGSGSATASMDSASAPPGAVFSARSRIQSQARSAGVGTAMPIITAPHGGVYTGRTAAPAFEPQSSADKSGAAEATLDFERQVHKEASLGVEVTGLEAVSERVEEMVKADGGFVASNELTTDADGYKSASLSVRIPTKDFETTLASFAKLGNVVSKNLSGEDITEKVSDANMTEQVLINDVREVETKIQREPMSEKRTGQKEAELRYLRIQLAQTRARLGLLKKMASLSTINLSLTEKAKRAAQTPPAPGFWTDLRDTNRAAASAFQSAVRVPVVLIIWVLAFSPLWVPLILAYRYAALKTMARAAVETARINHGTNPTEG